MSWSWDKLNLKNGDAANKFIYSTCKIREKIKLQMVKKSHHLNDVTENILFISCIIIWLTVRIKKVSKLMKTILI